MNVVFVYFPFENYLKTHFSYFFFLETIRECRADWR